MRPATDADVVVVGAGIVGLASAREIQRRHPGSSVVVLDKEPAPARHQTGRNSGVIHSGLYYRPGSDKARLVARGRQLLLRACDDWGVPTDLCGKVVVATEARQLRGLEDLRVRGLANGLEVSRITSSRLAQLEPHVQGLAALHVPEAGIVSYRAVAEALAADVVAAGGEVRTGAEVHEVARLGDTARPSGLRLTTGQAAPNGQNELTTSWLVNCAGLHSDRVARAAGSTTQVTIVPFRGEYHQLAPSAVGLVRNLVYPVPDPRWPFLGVHFTRMVDASVHVGPNAVLALGREAYDGGVDLRDTVAMIADPGLRRLARRYWATGAEELIRSRSSRLLLRDVCQLVPDISASDLEPAPSGIRAQALAPDGTLLDDFAFGDSPRAVHVLNAPSPAATASLAIAEVVADRLQVLMAG